MWVRYTYIICMYNMRDNSVCVHNIMVKLPTIVGGCGRHSHLSSSSSTYEIISCPPDKHYKYASLENNIAFSKQLHCVTKQRSMSRRASRISPSESIGNIIYFIFVDIKHSNTTTCTIIFVVISILNSSSFYSITVNKMLFIRPTFQLTVPKSIIFAY